MQKFAQGEWLHFRVSSSAVLFHFYYLGCFRSKRQGIVKALSAAGCKNFLTFSNISVISKDIYLKFRLVV